MMKIFSIAWAFWFLCFPVHSAFAWTENALGSSEFLAFTPNDLDLKNVTLDTSLAYEFVPGSLEWIRLDHQVTVPRAVVRLHLSKDGTVIYRGRSYASQNQTVEMLVTVLEEPDNKIELEKPAKSIAIKFKNTKALQARVVLDSTCSPYPVSVANVEMPNGWAIVFCQSTHPRAEEGLGFQLDLKVLWQSEESNPLLSEVILNSKSKEAKIIHGKNHFTVQSNPPDRFHPLSVGGGFGPYLHNDVLRPFFTVYAAYTLNEHSKVASFSAVPIGDSPHLDQGFYFITEQARALDDHLSVNLLLGAHFLEFDTGGTGYWRFSAPQGIEFQYKDFLAKHRALTFGTFYYPEINGTSYVNAWARYGWGSGFLEINYIRWKEPTETGSYSAKSFGISYGLPLFKAL